MAEKNIHLGKFINNLDSEDLTSEQLQGVVNNTYAKAIETHKKKAEFVDDEFEDKDKETDDFLKSNHDRLKANKDKIAKDLNESYSIIDSGTGDKFGNFSNMADAKTKALQYMNLGLNGGSVVIINNDNNKLFAVLSIGKVVPMGTAPTNESLTESKKLNERLTDQNGPEVFIKELFGIDGDSIESMINNTFGSYYSYISYNDIVAAFKQDKADNATRFAEVAKECGAKVRTYNTPNGIDVLVQFPSLHTVLYTVYSCKESGIDVSDVKPMYDMFSNFLKKISGSGLDESLKEAWDKEKWQRLSQHRKDLIDVYEATKDLTPADTVKELVDRVGYNEAMVDIAEGVNATGEWDRRVYEDVREWAKKIPGAATKKEMEEVRIFDLSSNIHSSHLNQIAQAAMRFKAEDETVEEGCAGCSEKLEESKEDLKENWTDAYKFFTKVSDMYFPDEDKIAEKVEALYKVFQGDPDFDEAYRRWHESDYDHFAEAYADLEDLLDEFDTNSTSADWDEIVDKHDNIYKEFISMSRRNALPEPILDRISRLERDFNKKFLNKMDIAISLDEHMDAGKNTDIDNIKAPEKKQ